MKSEEKRDILRAVAEGRLTPAEAAVLLELDGEAGPEGAAAPPPRGEGSLRAVRIVVPFGTTRVSGEQAVREAVADGPHSARHDGDVLVIEGEHVDDDGFSFGRADWKRTVFGLGPRARPLLVRMNPHIPLEIELAAGTLSVRDVLAPIRADVSAGTARIDGIASPVDIAVASGSVRVAGVLDRGDSRVRCEAGAVKVHLERGSSVRITARAGVGKVVLPGGPLRTGPEHRKGGWLLGGGTSESVVGSGAGTLEVDASIGTVSVTSDE